MLENKLRAYVDSILNTKYQMHADPNECVLIEQQVYAPSFKSQVCMYGCLRSRTFRNTYKSW